MVEIGPNLGGSGPRKPPPGWGVQNFKLTTRGRDYTQMKGLDEHFQDVTLVLPYDVIMTSLRGSKVEKLTKNRFFRIFTTFFQKIITPPVVGIFEFSQRILKDEIQG